MPKQHRNGGAPPERECASFREHKTVYEKQVQESPGTCASMHPVAGVALRWCCASLRYTCSTDAQWCCPIWAFHPSCRSFPVAAGGRFRLTRAAVRQASAAALQQSREWNSCWLMHGRRWRACSIGCSQKWS